MSVVEEDDVPQLSQHTLAALAEFYQEQELLDTPDEKDSSQMPKEDWQLSQFWYSEDTATKLAQESIGAAGPHGRIACISCPTLYKKLRELMPPEMTAVILEYDSRFSVFGEDFVLYDYKKPLEIPSHFEQKFDLVVADPPFLSEECLNKTSQTIKYMAKDKIFLCTGAIMAEHAKNLLNCDLLTFKPVHTNNLANEFRCYSNYDTHLLHS